MCHQFLYTVYLEIILNIENFEVSSTKLWDIIFLWYVFRKSCGDDEKNKLHYFWNIFLRFEVQFLNQRRSKNGTSSSMNDENTLIFQWSLSFWWSYDNHMNKA